jgi:DNA-binding GntR family transcriptional regulator
MSASRLAARPADPWDLDAPHPGSAASDDRAHRAYTRLRDLIIRGRITPGAPLVELDVAAQLGVSRTPVRAALQRLHQEGLVHGARGGRAHKFIVAPLTREDCHQLFDIVGALEGAAAYAVAGQPTTARRVVARHLRTANSAMRAAARERRPDHDRLLSLDEAFHRVYVDACENVRLGDLTRIAKAQAERYERIYVSFLTGQFETSAAEHDAIIRGIADGDALGAQHAVQTNWRNAADRLGSVIDVAGERGEW